MYKLSYLYNFQEKQEKPNMGLLPRSVATCESSLGFGGLSGVYVVCTKEGNSGWQSMNRVPSSSRVESSRLHRLRDLHISVSIARLFVGHSDHCIASARRPRQASLHFSRSFSCGDGDGWWWCLTRRRRLDGAVATDGEEPRRA